VAAFDDSPNLLSGLPRIHQAILLIVGVGALVQLGVVFIFMARSVWAFLDAVKQHINAHYAMVRRLIVSID